MRRIIRLGVFEFSSSLSSRFKLDCSSQFPTKSFSTMQSSVSHNEQKAAVSAVPPTRDCPCGTGGATYDVYTPEQVIDGINALKPFWSLSEDGKHISRHFACKNWKAAIDVITSISEIAERHNHHPDLHLTAYRNLEVTMTTNAVNALTASDFKLAAEIDTIPVEYSSKWLKANPEALKETA